MRSTLVAVTLLLIGATASPAQEFGKKKLKTFEVPQVRYGVMSADGKLIGLVTGWSTSSKNTAKILDVQSGKVVVEVAIKDLLLWPQFSPDARTFSCGNPDNAYAISIPSGKIKKTPGKYADIRNMTSRSGKRRVEFDSGNEARLKVFEGDKEIADLKSIGSSEVAPQRCFLPADDTNVVALYCIHYAGRSIDGFIEQEGGEKPYCLVRLLDISSGKFLPAYGFEEALHDVLHLDGKWRVLTSKGNVLTLWQLEEEKKK